jgi:protein-disulfide isomerase
MSKRAARKGKQSGLTPQWWYAGGAIGLLVLLAVSGITVQNRPPEVSDERLALEAHLGNANAAVEVIEYGAYGCHTCRATHQQGIVETLLASYGDQLRFTFRNWPVISPQNDPLAAEAAQCALDQSPQAFWQYHDALYDLSNRDYGQYQDRADFTNLAESIGLDAQALGDCLGQDTHQRTVDHWKEEADGLNLPGTPTFFVNGRRVNDPTQLEAIIQEALAAS